MLCSDHSLGPVTLLILERLAADYYSECQARFHFYGFEALDGIERVRSIERQRVRCTIRTDRGGVCADARFVTNSTTRERFQEASTMPSYDTYHTAKTRQTGKRRYEWQTNDLAT